MYNNTVADKKTPLTAIAFLQALGLTAYCTLVAFFLQNANSWFGKMDNFLASTLFLIIFVLSALICALIALGYPFILFWMKKQTTAALKLAALTTTWLTLFTAIAIAILALAS